MGTTRQYDTIPVHTHTLANINNLCTSTTGSTIFAHSPLIARRNELANWTYQSIVWYVAHEHPHKRVVSVSLIQPVHNVARVLVGQDGRNHSIQMYSEVKERKQLEKKKKSKWSTAETHAQSFHTICIGYGAIIIRTNRDIGRNSAGTNSKPLLLCMSINKYIMLCSMHTAALFYTVR